MNELTSQAEESFIHLDYVLERNGTSAAWIQFALLAVDGVAVVKCRQAINDGSPWRTPSAEQLRRLEAEGGRTQADQNYASSLSPFARRNADGSL